MPSFTVLLKEAAKPRKVFFPYLPRPGTQPQEPYVADIYAFRLIRNDQPEQNFVYLFSGFYWSEENARKVVQFKKDFDKNRGVIPDHVDEVNLRLICDGVELQFDLRTGQCMTDVLQVPDGFFDAVADALADLGKLKAGKPSFRVK